MSGETAPSLCVNWRNENDVGRLELTTEVLVWTKHHCAVFSYQAEKLHGIIPEDVLHLAVGQLL